jgi:hypothetical protein
VQICRKPPNLWGNYNIQIYTSNTLVVPARTNVYTHAHTTNLVAPGRALFVQRRMSYNADSHSGTRYMQAKGQAVGRHKKETTES